MVRRVFFSFDYDRDIWRVSQVRKSWVTKPDREEAGFIDAASWEEIRHKSKEAILRWIDSQLEGTSVTVVLIGAETYKSKYVKYEIKESFERGNKLLGIRIHNLEDSRGSSDIRGKNPFDLLTINGKPLSQIFPTYDWVRDDGYNNFADWIEDAPSA